MKALVYFIEKLESLTNKEADVFLVNFQTPIKQILKNDVQNYAPNVVKKITSSQLNKKSTFFKT